MKDVDEALTLASLVVRTARTERRMLSDALDALSKGKCHVAIDHMERVQDALAKLESVALQFIRG